jgi:hypothetical protein
MKSITHSGDVDSSFDKVNPEFKEGYTISLNAIEVEDEKNDTYLVTFFVYTNSTIGHLLEFKNIKKGTPRNVGNFKNSPVFLNIYIQKNQNRNVSIKYGSKTTLLSVGKDELKF